MADRPPLSPQAVDHEVLGDRAGVHPADVRLLVEQTDVFNLQVNAGREFRKRLVVGDLERERALAGTEVPLHRDRLVVQEQAQQHQLAALGGGVRDFVEELSVRSVESDCGAGFPFPAIRLEPQELLHPVIGEFGAFADPDGDVTLVGQSASLAAQFAAVVTGQRIDDVLLPVVARLENRSIVFGKAERIRRPLAKHLDQSAMKRSGPVDIRQFQQCRSPLLCLDRVQQSVEANGFVPGTNERRRQEAVVVSPQPPDPHRQLLPVTNLLKGKQSAQQRRRVLTC